MNIPVPLELGEHFGPYNHVRVHAQNNFLGVIQEYNLNGSVSTELGLQYSNYSLDRYEERVDTIDVKSIKVSTKTEFISKKSIGTVIGIYFNPLRTHRIRLKIGINYLPTFYEFKQQKLEYNDSIYLNLQFNLMLFNHRNITTN